jgi:type I restriction enzyme S subunit
MNWKKERLKSLGWLRSAGVNKLIDPNQREVNLINYMDVYRNHQITDKIDFQKVTAKDSELENANVLIGDVLFTPSSEKPTDIGHAGVVTQELKNTVYSYHLVRFRFHNVSNFDPLFLSYLLNTYKTEKHFVTRATGTTRYTLSLKDFQSLEIEYPEDLKEQKAIAAILSKVDGAIKATENSIKAAEKLKKSLMQNLLIGKLKPDGTWRKEDEFYKHEKFGNCPTGWHWGRLSEIADVVAGQSPSGEYYNEDGIGTPMLNGPTEFTDLHPIPVQFTTKVTKLCQVGDILFTVRGSSTGRMNFADQEYCIGRGIAAIRAKAGSDIDFIYYTLVTISEKILAEAKGAGTTFPNVSRGELLKKWVLIPDTGQANISARIKSIDVFLKQKEGKVTAIQRLKKSLMQNLLTGRVRVDLSKIEKLIPAHDIT